MGVGALVIGMSQISSFFHTILNCKTAKLFLSMLFRNHGMFLDYLC